MKLRNKIATITAAAMLAFTGVGFAAWTFTNTVQDSATATGNVTCAIESKEVKVYNGDAEIENIYLVFDAPETAAGDRKAGDGIFYCSDITDAENTKITKLTLKGEITHEQESLHYKDNAEKVLFQVVETNNLPSAHVTFTAGSLVSAEQNIVAGTTLYETDYNLPTYAYVSAPTDVAGVNALYSALNGRTLVLSFSFGIEA